MSISSIGARGSGVSGSSSNTVTQTPGATVAVGRILFTFVVLNSSSGVNVASIGDALGNVWTLCALEQGTLARVEVWMCRVTTQLASNTTITVTFNANVTDKCVASWEFQVGAGKTLGQDASSVGNTTLASNGFGSVSHSGLSSKERLYLRCAAKQANSTTAITQSTNFTTWALTIRSRNNASAIVGRAEHRINTSTGETSNPTMAVAGNTAAEFLALAEYDVPEASTAPSTFTDASVAPTPTATASPAVSSATLASAAATVASSSSTTPSTIGDASTAPVLAADGTTSPSTQAFESVDPTWEEIPDETTTNTTPSTFALTSVAPSTDQGSATTPSAASFAAVAPEGVLGHDVAVSDVGLAGVATVAGLSVAPEVSELGAASVATGAFATSLSTPGAASLASTATSSETSKSTTPSEFEFATVEPVGQTGGDSGYQAPPKPLSVGLRFGF